MKRFDRVLAVSSLSSLVFASSVAEAQLGNLTYSSQEVGHPIDLFQGANMPGGPGGIDTVFMVHGYLVVLGTKDSGKPPGAFHFFDVTDPKNPKLLKTYADADTANLREYHMWTSSKVGGKDVYVCPTTTGLAFFDFTDVMNPKLAGNLTLTGVNGGDYTNVAWMSSYSWPYVFTGSSGSGVNITDATDPTKPVLIKTVPIGQIGNFRVGPTYAAGNYLVITNMDQDPFRASVLDVSDPKNPSLLTTVTSPNGNYSSLVIGDWIFGGGTNANYTFAKWTPTAIKVVATKKIGTDKGAYCTLQDNFGICGQSSDGFHKIDLTDETNPTAVGGGVMGGTYPVPEGDFDFATVMGNLVFEGNDHDVHPGGGFIPHQMAPDTTPPKVLKVYPEDQATKQPLSTRVTVFFTDELDMDTVSATSIVLQKVGGSAIDAVLSHSSTNAISIGPKQALEPNSTYEVLVVSGGVKDIMGNAILGDTSSRFSTGTTVAPPVDGGTTTGGNVDAGSDSSTVGAGGSGSGGAGSGATTSAATSTTGSGGTDTSSSTGATGGSDSTGATSTSGTGTYVTGTTSASSTTGGGAGGGGNAPANQSSGCACSTPGRPTAGGAWVLVALAIDAGLSRLRRRRPRGR
jgi:hypothetical protein